MQLTININFPNLDEKLDRILNLLHQLVKQEQQEIITLSELEDKVAALEASVTDENTVIDGATTLLTELSQLLKDALNAGAPQEVINRVATIVNAIDVKKQALADAVVANTPQVPATKVSEASDSGKTPTPIK